MARLFSPGRVCVTPGIKMLMAQGHDIFPFLNRHIQGDWGVLSDDDKLSNDDVVATHDGRILSAYYVTPEVKIWILTDDGMTVIMLPSEY